MKIARGPQGPDNAQMDKVDAVVIGAGVVGLATARALALSGLEVLIVEREDAIGTRCLLAQQ